MTNDPRCRKTHSGNTIHAPAPGDAVQTTIAGVTWNIRFVDDGTLQIVAVTDGRTLIYSKGHDNILRLGAQSA